MLIRPHRDAQRAAQGTPRLANLEEVHTAPPQDERPLVLFTVLAQMAVGAFITPGVFVLQLGATEAKIPVLFTGLIMLSALLLSLLHLGSPQRAYRAIANWRTSWLSREILIAGSIHCRAGVVQFTAMVLSPGHSLPPSSRYYWRVGFKPGYCVQDRVLLDRPGWIGASLQHLAGLPPTHNQGVELSSHHRSILRHINSAWAATGRHVTLSKYFANHKL